MKANIKLFLLLICLIYGFSSCVTNRQTNLLQDIAKDYPAINNPDEYRIIPGDQLTITVYAMDPEVDNLFRGYTTSLRGAVNSTEIYANTWSLRNAEVSYDIKPVSVYADGTINFPYIGKVYVQGLTMLEARNLISQKLNSFAEGTSAEVVLSNKFFSIIGEVGPQRVILPANRMTIYQALALANSIESYGDRSKITVMRQTKDGTEVKTFDLRSKDVIDSEYYYIQPNDVVYVPQMKRKFFGGTNSFVGTFSLLTSLTTFVIFAVKLF